MVRNEEAYDRGMQPATRCLRCIDIRHVAQLALVRGLHCSRSLMYKVDQQHMVCMYAGGYGEQAQSHPGSAHAQPGPAVVCQAEGEPPGISPHSHPD